MADWMYSADASNVWLDGLLWGTQWSSVGGKTVINTYIAGRSGREWVDDGSGYDMRVYQPSAKEVAAMRAAMTSFEAVSNVKFNMVGSKQEADLVWATAPKEYFRMEGGGQALGWANPPGNGYAYGEAQSLVAINGDLYATDPSSSAFLAKGGYDYCTFIHELGHAVGLAHPHDSSGGTSTIFPGVESPFGDTGDFGMNQGIYTMMTYNDGWWDRHMGDLPSWNWGMQFGPMALDIAALQWMYGVNTSTRTGNDVYQLPGSNGIGTGFSCIWDAGGIDTIQGASSRSNNIDLRAATLQYEQGGGGWVSAASGVYGGFTIANGAIIENATGGNKSDRLTGNEVGNLLKGRDGDDWLLGMGGNDVLNGGNGRDRLYGGAGNDIYLFRSGDRITEGFDGGTDEVRANAGHTLGANLENLLLGGPSAINGTGNGLDNVLTGNGASNVLKGQDGWDSLRGMGGVDTLDGGTGDDRLDGGAGRDRLAGGLGADIFVFRTLGEAGDSISDFKSEPGNYDRIEIGAAGFGGGLAAGGSLLADQLQIRGDNLALDEDDRLIFRTTDNTLWFDADGAGAGAAVMVADLQAGATLTSEQILLV